MLLHRMFTPEEVLTVLAQVIQEGLAVDLQGADVTATFVDDRGTVEVSVHKPDARHTSGNAAKAS
jgi:hypothetical protein